MPDMGLTETITLAGKTYEVREPPLEVSEKFEAALGPALQEYLPELLDKVAPLLGELDTDDLKSIQAAADTDASERPLRNSAIFAAALETAPLLIRLVGSVSQLVDLMLLGAPELAADAERIRKEARRSEIIIPFWKVLNLNFPFQAWGRQLLDMLPAGTRETLNRELGSDDSQTGQNSSMQSMDSGSETVETNHRKRQRSQRPKPAN